MACRSDLASTRGIGSRLHRYVMTWPTPSGQLASESIRLGVAFFKVGVSPSRVSVFLLVSEFPLETTKKGYPQKERIMPSIAGDAVGQLLSQLCQHLST